MIMKAIRNIICKISRFAPLECHIIVTGLFKMNLSLSPLKIELTVGYYFLNKDMIFN